MSGFGTARPASEAVESMQTPVEVIQGQLLSRIAQRDLQALSEFYDSIATPLFSVALRILRDPTEAEEVIQDVFVQVWEKAPLFDGRLGSAFGWALSITRHRAIDRLRSKQRQARLVEELLALSEAEPPVTPLPDEAGADAEQAMSVRRAVAALPNEQRQPIELAFFAGLTHPEISEALNEPLGTVKARIRRGLLKLRGSLEVEHK